MLAVCLERSVSLMQYRDPQPEDSSVRAEIKRQWTEAGTETEM